MPSPPRSGYLLTQSHEEGRLLGIRIALLVALCEPYCGFAATFFSASPFFLCVPA